MIETVENIVIGKGKGDESEYTIFRNNNKELVEKIKAVTIPEDVFEDWDGEKYKIESTTSDGQYLCKTLKGKTILVDKKSHNECRKNEKLNKINNLYPVSKYFNENFGYYFGDKIIIVGGNSKGGYNDLGKVNVATLDFYNNFSEDGSIYVSSCFKSRMVGFHFCHFNEEGNYVNRDYNLDLKRLLKYPAPITQQELIEKVSAAIPDLPYMYCEKKNIWFTDSFAYTLKITFDEKDEYFGFSIEKIPVKENGKFGKQYVNQFSMPKRGLLESSKNEIVERILPVINKLRLK
jgi:hypothetical protein